VYFSSSSSKSLAVVAVCRKVARPHLDLEHGKVTIHRTIDREVDDEAPKARS